MPSYAYQRFSFSSLDDAHEQCRDRKHTTETSEPYFCSFISGRLALVGGHWNRRPPPPHFCGASCSRCRTPKDGYVMHSVKDTRHAFREGYTNVGALLYYYNIMLLLSRLAERLASSRVSRGAETQPLAKAGTR